MPYRRIKIVALLAVVCAVHGMSGGGADANDWPHFRGPDRDGIVADPGLSENWAENEPEILYRNMRTQMNGAVLREGYLYGFDESELRCLNFETGEVKWRQRGLGKGTLIMADGKLVILSEDGRLVIAQASPEQYTPITLKRILPEGSRCWTMPILAAGRIYARNAAGDVVCVDISGR